MRRALGTTMISSALAAGATGCADITPPARSPAYPFALGGDVFHWPIDRMPVRYFADTRGAMVALVRGGLLAWERQFLYAEFRGVLVVDSGAADVIVLWADTVPPEVPPDTTGAVGACGGLTSFVVDSTNTMTGPIRVELRVNGGYTLGQVAACMRRVAVHELGHTLGVLPHSSDTGDVMFGTPRADGPTARDRATVEILYHTPATIRPPARR